ESTWSAVRSAGRRVVRWRASVSWLGSVGWATAWTASKHDPSDTVRNDRPPPALESRRVRTQPLTVTVEPTATSPFRTAATEGSGNRQRALHDVVDLAVERVGAGREGRDVGHVLEGAERDHVG